MICIQVTKWTRSTFVLPRVAVVARVLPLSDLMGAIVVGSSPASALTTPLHLGILDHLLMRRMAFEVQNWFQASQGTSALPILWAIGRVPCVGAWLDQVDLSK